jgi:hypothetical protein
MVEKVLLISTLRIDGLFHQVLSIVFGQLTIHQQ